MDCHALLQEIFPTQGLNLGFLHCRQILYHLSHLYIQIFRPSISISSIYKYDAHILKMDWLIFSHWNSTLVLLSFSHPVVMTLCNPMDCSMPGLSVPHHLQKFVQVHVHCIDDAIQPSHHINKDFTSISDSSLPKCEFLVHAPVNICHTKNSRMSQSFTGGRGQVFPLMQTLMYAYYNKSSKIRVKVTEADSV